MEFPLTGETLQQIKNRLTSDPENPLYQDVRCVVMSGFSNLIELLPELTHFPAAVITSGNIRPINIGATRETEIAIIVIDEFRVSPDDLSGINLIDKTLELLSPELPGQVLKLGKAHLIFHSVTPIDLSDMQHTAWNITFTAKTSFKN